MAIVVRTSGLALLTQTLQSLPIKASEQLHFSQFPPFVRPVGVCVSSDRLSFSQLSTICPTLLHMSRPSSSSVLLCFLIFFIRLSSQTHTHTHTVDLFRLICSAFAQHWRRFDIRQSCVGVSCDHWLQLTTRSCQLLIWFWSKFN